MLDRRHFVQLAGAALAASILPGCAAQVVERVVPRDGTLRLPLDRYPQLTRPGGSARVRPEGSADTIYVLALDDGRIAAVSPICTHRGCTVGIEGPLLVCPCHGSTYDREGHVVRGPAPRSLRSFAVERAADVIVVRLEETAT